MTENKDGKFSITDFKADVKKGENGVFTGQFGYNFSEVGQIPYVLIQFGKEFRFIQLSASPLKTDDNWLKPAVK